MRWKVVWFSSGAEDLWKCIKMKVLKVLVKYVTWSAGHKRTNSQMIFCSGHLGLIQHWFTSIFSVFHSSLSVGSGDILPTVSCYIQYWQYFCHKLYFFRGFFSSLCFLSCSSDLFNLISSTYLPPTFFLSYPLIQSHTHTSHKYTFLLSYTLQTHTLLPKMHRPAAHRPFHWPIKQPELYGSTDFKYINYAEQKKRGGEKVGEEVKRAGENTWKAKAPLRVIKRRKIVHQSAWEKRGGGEEGG